MKQLVVTLAGCLSIYLGLAGWHYFSTWDLRQGPEVIRARIMEQTPLGTDMETVQTYCVRELSECRMDNNSGFVRYRPGERDVTVGVKSIRGDMGTYRYEGVFRTDVFAYWGFDEHGKLVDVWINGEIDAL